jgi:hypothetical protein
MGVHLQHSKIYGHLVRLATYEDAHTGTWAPDKQRHLTPLPTHEGPK